MVLKTKMAELQILTWPGTTPTLVGSGTVCYILVLFPSYLLVLILARLVTYRDVSFDVTVT